MEGTPYSRFIATAFLGLGLVLGVACLGEKEWVELVGAWALRWIGCFDQVHCSFHVDSVVRSLGDARSVAKGVAGTGSLVCGDCFWGGFFAALIMDAG